MFFLSLSFLFSAPVQAYQPSSNYGCSLDTVYQSKSSTTYFGTALLASEEEDEDTNGDDGVLQRQAAFFGSKYNHPAFNVSHNIGTVGAVMMVGGTVFILSGVVLVLPGLILAFTGDDNLLNVSLGAMAVGASGLILGGTTAIIGSLSAGIVLRKMGQEAPFTGLIITGAGLAAIVAQATLLDDNAPGVVGGLGMIAIPAGLITQTITNKVHYNRYVESLSIAPTFSTDSVGAVAQFTF